MTIPKDLVEYVTVDPEVLGGTPCFKGTRVPLATFLDHVEMGISLEQFLSGFSSVQRVQAEAVLKWQARESRRS